MKKMKDVDNALKNLKKEVGKRFKAFRLNKKKAQNILASELLVHQSTITNIEHGTTFPKVNYLHYFYEKYGINLNWLVTGEGEMYLKEPTQQLASRIMSSPMEYGDSKFDKYQELGSLLQIPVIEQVMFAKLSECKILFKDEVQKHIEKEEKEKRTKRRKISRAKVKK